MKKDIECRLHVRVSLFISTEQYQTYNCYLVGLKIISDSKTLNTITKAMSGYLKWINYAQKSF